MEGVIPALIVMISMVVSLVSSAKKEKEKQAAEARRLEAAARRAANRQQLERTAAPSRQASAQPRPASAPSPRPAQPAMPTVHAHIQPDCETHDAPGSLAFTSTEGKDPCHEEQLASLRPTAEPAQENPALTFDWTGDAMVKAVVMQEILTRPSQRRAR